MSADGAAPDPQAGGTALAPAGPLTREALRSLRHELRTPLNHILGYGELLLEETTYRALPDLAPPLETLCAAARQAVDIISDLLDVTRLEMHPEGLASADAALAPLLDQIGAQLVALQENVVALGQDDLLPDLQRIEAAASHLRALAHDSFREAAAAIASPPLDTAPPTAPADGARPTPETPALEGPAQTAQGVLLLVDDNELNRDMLGRRLERLGYTVLLAENGREALDVLAARPVDVLLLDIMMPVMDGYEVLERRRADPRLRDIPCLVISALDELDSVVRCIEMGAEDYLPKPFDPVLLRARVGACLEKKRLRDQEQAHLATIERQAAELAEWNHTLEARVQQQVSELERLTRLRRFLSPQVAEAIVSAGNEQFLESHRGEVTVVFTDLRGFTAFSGTAEPEEVMAVLREYHQAMGALIFRYEGTLERFAGDGLMVFFNDPICYADHTSRAVRMAVEMRAAVAELAKVWRARGHQLGFGVGIAQGYATLGKIGFEGRFDYAAIGTVTNLASRLSDEARAGEILVNDRAYLAVEAEVEAKPIDPLPLKGFPTPVPAYSIFGLRR